MPEINLQSLLDLGMFGFFFATVISFCLLYFSFTSAAYFYFTQGTKFQLYQKKEFRTDQIKTEIKRSLISILMFGVLAFPMYIALQAGFFKLNFEFSLIKLVTEMIGLFFWNEIYFYIVHRTFHFKPFYKWHADHHYSHVPSPFSAYSFHWSEGILLGAVMPFAMCFYDFQFWSLMTLPVMSISMNVLGHSNVDFFPEKDMNSLLSFSKRHSQHHKIPHSNYGFFLPYFDTIMGTDTRRTDG